MSARILKDLGAAEAKLPQLDASALRSLPDRVARCLKAIASLERGDRAGVATEAAAIRASGSDEDIAAILELAMESPTSRGATSSGPIPGLFAALDSWRSGKKPRGSAALRRLATERPALRALLSVLGRRRTLAWDTLALSRLSKRLPSVTAVAHGLSQPRPSASTVKRLIRPLDPTVDLSRYFGAGLTADPSAPVRAWASDVTIPWSDEQTDAAAIAAGKRQGLAGAVLADLLRGIQRRVSSGIVHDVGPALAIAPHLAKPARSDRQLVPNIEVLQRRVGLLLDPHANLPALLTLWRRCVGRPPAERLLLAKTIARTIRAMVARDEPPPPELHFAVEALLYLMSMTADIDAQVDLIRDFGMLLPRAPVASLMERADPSTRRHAEGLHALSHDRLGEALDSVVSLAESGSYAPASGLLIECLYEIIDDSHSHRSAGLRRFDRTIETLRALPSLRLDPLALPLLLEAAALSDLRPEPVEALVRQQLVHSLADGDPGIAGQLSACVQLGDDARLQELIRELGRWLRRPPVPDTADDLAFEILAQVYGDLSIFDEPELVHRALAPLSSFVLRAGSERALRAATRAGTKSEKNATGCGRWALEHIDRLDDPHRWGFLIDLARPRLPSNIFELLEELPF